MHQAHGDAIHDAIPLAVGSEQAPQPLPGRMQNPPVSLIASIIAWRRIATSHQRTAASWTPYIPQTQWPREEHIQIARITVALHRHSDPRRRQVSFGGSVSSGMNGRNRLNSNHVMIFSRRSMRGVHSLVGIVSLGSRDPIASGLCSGR